MSRTALIAIGVVAILAGLGYAAHSFDLLQLARSVHGG
jgi:hypothetical protein